MVKIIKIKINIIKTLTVFYLWLLFFSISNLAAQKYIYIPSDSTVSIMNFDDVKKNLQDAFNKTTYIQKEDMSDVFKTYPDIYNNIEKSLVTKTKFEFIVLKPFPFSRPDIKQLTLSYNFSEINNIRIQSLKTDPEKIKQYVITLIDMDFYWKGSDYNFAKQFADAFFILKNKKYQESSSPDDLTNFEKIAEQYRSLEQKPGITEEVRKYIVQANVMTKEKNYAEAIKLFKKALAIDPTYPDAHFNLALLLGQVNDYENAIIEMKKYLMLVPDSKDARAAQDKIYEWEIKKEKQE